MCPEKSHPAENKERSLLAYTAGVDAWAAGVLAYELLVGCVFLTALVGAPVCMPNTGLKPQEIWSSTSPPLHVAGNMLLAGPVV